MRLKTILDKLKMGNHGVAIIWVEILLAIGVVSMVYIIFSYIIYSTNGIANLVNTSSEVINNTRAQSTLNIINIVWQYWPLIFIVGLIMYGFVASQRREPDQSIYG
jgi:hypothetical protein